MFLILKWHVYVQWIATFAVFTKLLQSGFHIGWASPNLARLTLPNSTIPLSNDEASWIASCGSYGGIVGALVGAFSIQILGSKNTLILSLILDVIQWLCLVLANSSIWILFSRLIGGASGSVALSSFSLYLAEVTEPGNRGACISTAYVGVPVGIVIGNVAETYWTDSSDYFYLVTCLFDILLLWWLKNSPYYLVKVKNVVEADKAIKFYYPTRDVGEELMYIRMYVETDVDLKSRMEELNKPVNRRSLLLIVILFCLPSICGVFSLVWYMEIILKKGELNLVDPKNFVILANVVAAVASCLPIILVDKFGRRILLILSSVGTAIAMVGLGFYFHLIRGESDNRGLQWLPMFFVLLCSVSFTIGLQSIPSTVLSEIFPDKIKNVAACISIVAYSLTCGVSLRMYQPLLEALGESSVFFTYGVLSLSAIPVALFFMPETKGKSLQEIQALLMEKRSGISDEERSTSSS